MNVVKKKSKAETWLESVERDENGGMPFTLAQLLEDYAKDVVSKLCVHDEVRFVPQSEEHECFKCGTFIEMH